MAKLHLLSPEGFLMVKTWPNYISSCAFLTFPPPLAIDGCGTHLLYVLDDLHAYWLLLSDRCIGDD
jgi:hypothetical protein